MLANFSTSLLALSGRIEGKVSLITGGNSGLGLACVKRLHEEGSKVICADINDDIVKPVIEKMNKEEPGSAIFIKLDVSKEQDWKNCMDTIKKKYGKLNVCVNNAGITSTKHIEKETLEGFRRLTSINYDGVFLGCKYSVGLMKENTEDCSIINMSSIEGLIGDPNLPAYGAAKGGVKIMSKNVALHTARKKYNIRCNSVCPGFIMTPMISGSSEKAINGLISKHPIGRLGEPVDIANGVLFLASEESSFMTGTELIIDGGYTCQ